MNKKALLSLLGLCLTVSLNAQTIYVPNGTSGIGISATGNVGVGTNNSPDYKLQVQKTNTLPAFMIGGGYSGSPRIQTYGLDADPNAWMGLGTDMSGHIYEHSIYFPYANGAGRLTIGSYNGSSYNTKITVLENGNIGIGTENPENKLVVNGSIKTYNIDNPSANWDNLSLWSDGEHSYIYSDGDEKGLFIKSKTGNKIILESNVGIGTSDPKNLLDVKGTIRAKEVKVVSDSEWPDFVFKPDYQLKPLSEVEEFINTNGHLPEIPTAKQVEQNGVNLGEMNVKLLQKVEELTLYLIEKEKKIKVLEERCSDYDTLKTRIEKIENALNNK